MVQAMIRVSDKANQILNVVKAKYNLNDKSEAIEHIVVEYGKNILEPELRPDYIEKMLIRKSEDTVKISNFRKHFGIE